MRTRRLCGANSDPIRVDPIPAPYRFAVTFVDDTDLSTRENTEPVYDFLYDQGFRTTKTVWIRPAFRRSAFRTAETLLGPNSAFAGQTLADSDYLEFVRKLQISGFEVAFHGVSAGNSTRDEVADGLNTFREVLGCLPRMYTCHARNIENPYAGYAKLDIGLLKLVERLLHQSQYQGHVRGSRFFWGDLCKQWITYVRLPFHTISEINTLKVNPSMPFFDPRRPYANYWFANSDGADVDRFCRLFTQNNIERLIRERGISLVYTHFAKGFAKNSAGHYFVDKSFRRIIEAIRERGDAWTVPASEILDRIRVVRRLGVRQDGHAVVFTNPSHTDVEAVQVEVRNGWHLRSETGERMVEVSPGVLSLGTLKALSETRCLANRIGNWCRGPIGDLAEPGERRQIELKNYLGEARDVFLKAMRYAFLNRRR